MNFIAIMLRSHLKLIIVIVVSVAIFIYTIHPVTTFDTFFGLKIGEWVVKKGQIPSTEPFSWVAYGREIIAYEWLAQVWVYLLHSYGSFKALEIYVAASLAIFFLINFAILYKALTRDFLSSLAISVFLSISLYEFFVARPQTIAFICLSLLLFLIFLYLFKQKNYLWFLLPITYIWTNSHASFIFIPFLLFSYGVLGGLFFKSKKVFKTLTLFTLFSILITLLPPLWYKPYQLLLRFTADLPFMTSFVSEWASLTLSPAYQIFYFFLVVITMLISIFFSIKNKLHKKWFLALPLVFISLASFQALRHIPLGSITSVITLALFLPKLSLTKPKLYLTIIILVGLSILTAWLAVSKKAPIFDTIWNIPSSQIDRDIQFIKNSQFRGKMFNEFAVGGYFLYYLYPQYQIFFDGRADIYHCCEMRQYWKLIMAKYSQKKEFAKAVNEFINTYQFSFMLIPTYTYNPLEFNTTNMMADTLLDDPSWRLVYFSDFIQILVRDDGLNQYFFDNGFKSATPYRFLPSRLGQEKEALKEYLRQLEIQDSSVLRTGLGTIYLELSGDDHAKMALEKAIALKPRNGRAYLGLAKVHLKKNQINQAIISLKKAIQLAPFLGEAYLTLGKTYHQIGQKELAKQILEVGLKQNIDFISLKEIVKALDSI